MLSNYEDHVSYDRVALKILADTNVKKLNEKQLIVFNQIISRLESQNKTGENLFFLDGPGGTGKTFLYNTILARVRSEGKIAISVATSGIAASLLDGGVTAHSIFRIPINVDADSTCNIDTQSELAELIRKTDLIIWDEAVMASKHVYMAVDRTFRDIIKFNKDKAFANKVLLLGGDFRQVLPVCKRGNRSKIVNSTIKKAPFWKHFINPKLTENMRIMTAAKNHGKPSHLLNEFSNFLLQTGEGLIPHNINTKYEDEIILPYNISRNIDEHELIEAVFPDIANNSLNVEFMTSRAILAPKNSDVNRINDIAVKYLPGQEKIYLSTDSVTCPRQKTIYPVEFLNKLSASSIPQHILTLKLNQPIMLLRNIAQTSGLCNGTRLIIRGMFEFI